MDYWGPRVALILCSIFLIALIAFLIYTWIKGYNTEFWKQVTGRIVESKIVKVDDSDGYHFQAIIVYTYEINGLAKKGSNWYRSGPKIFQNKRSAEAFVEENHVNKEVKVHVNPKNDSESCLRTMESAGLLFGIILAVFMLIFCIAKWESL